ncbi:hypothetical protein BV898_14238 [Hypsibius exemplaris]|uniref:GH16 domain-containing protein n=1 Tax=Hypsibius exemplaris TaxID=2072580 RepID=A0A1W0W8G2_HYPEX|nr:hypothetical protein BV898_14238 [Hypsibius exemplaris]
MEFRGDYTNLYTMAVHHGVWPNIVYDAGSSHGPDLTADFHTYKCIWDPNFIAWFRDGQEVYRVSDWNKIPHEPMYLVMNVAVGGGYPGYPDWSTPFPTHMVVDYVTVHKWQ